ncbi:hypothetical protein HanRHA438_Chr02g0066431 [Helianthus annuus]|nr:hypothetical protein HanRHA438_Chr02g0066431 [Helianthus annuus]
MQVDCLIGKNHLFKCSIILIKSWCYYESHIMGAMYGLLSTYALETLVLYIFGMYNASLASPMVLYVLLEYYSKFNWDKFGISIDGPVNFSLLPNIVVENPTHHAIFGGQFLGAGTLAEILELPMEKIEERNKNFFGNTLKMNRSKFGLRPRLTF